MTDVEQAKKLYREADGLCACGRALMPDLDDRTIHRLEGDDDTRVVCATCYTREMFAFMTHDLELESQGPEATDPGL